MGLTLILIVMFALLWLLLIRPQRRRANEQLRMQDSLRAGDEIITAGGIHGRITAIEDDVASVEIAPGTVVRLDRRAVAAVASPEEFEAEEETEDESEPVSTGGS